MTAPLQTPDSSGLASSNARDWGVQIDTSTTATPTWVFINGLDTVEVKIDPTMVDDTDKDARGYASQFTTGQAFTINLAGKRKGALVGSTYTADAGTEALRAKGNLTGQANIAHIRVWRTDNLPDSYEAYMAASFVNGTGGNTDLQTYTSSLVGRGKPLTPAKPPAV